MLSEVRKLIDLTQKDLAALVGVTQNYYAVIESHPTKSAPLMQKLSKELKISEQFLAVGDRSRYPFLGKFYTFYLDPFKPFLGYGFLNNYICSESSFIDIVIFLDRTENWLVYSASSICFAMRDEHDTIFLVTSKSKPRFGVSSRVKPETKKEAKEPTTVKYFVPKVDLFRKDLYKNNRLLVYEKTVIASESLCLNLAKGKVNRKDVEGFFPDINHFKQLYEVHKNIVK